MENLGRECDDVGRLGERTISDGHCGMGDGFTKVEDGKKASSLEDFDNLMIAYTPSSIT